MNDEGHQELQTSISLHFDRSGICSNYSNSQVCPYLSTRIRFSIDLEPFCYVVKILNSAQNLRRFHGLVANQRVWGPSDLGSIIHTVTKN